MRLLLGGVPLFISVLAFGFSSSLYAGEKIVMIGDSHLEGTFGQTLLEGLRADPSNQIALYGVGGSTAENWLKGIPGQWGSYFWTPETGGIRKDKPQTPMLSQLLDLRRPDRVVVSLGTNYIWTETLDEKAIIKQVQDTVYAIHSRGMKCTWVGPPRLEAPGKERSGLDEEAAAFRLNRVNAILATQVQAAGCHWIDCFPFTRYSGAQPGDGIHFDTMGPSGTTLARQWGKNVLKRIQKVQMMSLLESSHSQSTSKPVPAVSTGGVASPPVPAQGLR